MWIGDKIFEAATKRNSIRLHELVIRSGEYHGSHELSRLAASREALRELEPDKVARRELQFTRR